MILTHDTNFYSFIILFFSTVYSRFHTTKCELCCSENAIGLADGCFSIPVQFKKSMCHPRPSLSNRSHARPRKTPQTTTITKIVTRARTNRRTRNQRLDILLKYRMALGTSMMRHPSTAIALEKWSLVRLQCRFAVHRWRYGVRLKASTDRNQELMLIFFFRLQVHWLSEPKRIMCSQVFLSPTCSRLNSSCSGGGSASTTTSNDGFQPADMPNCDTNVMETHSSFIANHKSRSTHPLDVPLLPSTASATTIDESERSYSHCDSGFSGNDAWMCSASQTSQSSSYLPRSGRSSIASVFSNDPCGSSRKLSIDSAILVDAAINGRSSDGCMQRRIRRNMSTSFENDFAKNDFIGFFADYPSSNTTQIKSATRRFSDLSGESRSNPEMVRKRKNSSKERLPPPHFSSYSTTKAKSTSSRRSKIGLAVCITFTDASEDEMQLFCSEHIALFESMLYRLRMAAESAYVNQKKFHQVSERRVSGVSIVEYSRIHVRRWCCTHGFRQPLG